MYIRATMPKTVPMDMCTKQRIRSAGVTAQSDQSIHCMLLGYARDQDLIIQTVNVITRLYGAQAVKHTKCCLSNKEAHVHFESK